ncbi:MAG: hypothetical protein WCV69_00050 [Patescibacteria group bacterium]|jgi:uncharacterized membrane protein
MNTPQIYILVSIIALAVIMLVLIFTRKKMQKPLSKLASFAFVFVIAGIVFGNGDWLGYSLMGIGIVLAIIDSIKKSKNKKV